jgi:UDP-N-acetylmuramoyl-tripeptide--D-alanyl-D-alanine ligase
MITARTVLNAEPTARLVLGDPASVFSACAVDSRTIQGGELFVAVQGPSRDGHAFVGPALAAGARGVLVSHLSDSYPPETVVIQTPDPRAALLAIGARVRGETAARVIAVTGSVGKTTTKDFIAHILSTRFALVASAASFNNDLGVPLTLTRLDANTAWAVLEIGASHSGEVRKLSVVARPHIAAVTNIGFAHIGQFGSLDATARAKLEILAGMPIGGTLIINGDDARLLQFATRLRGTSTKLVLVGADPSNDLVLEKIDATGSKLVVQMRSARNSREVVLPLLGAHFAYALAIAVATAMEASIPFDEAVSACKDFRTPPGRMRVFELGDRVTVIDDSYNGSPDSTIAGLRSLLAFDRKRIAVLGEMRELGVFTAECHQMAGRALAGAATCAVLVGAADARIVQESACAAGMADGDITIVASATEALAVVRRLVAEAREPVVLYIKGARFRHMERVRLGLEGLPVACSLSECQLYINCSTCPQL